MFVLLPSFSAGNVSRLDPQRPDSYERVISIITGATHPSLRRTVGSPGAIASLFSEAARPRDPPFRSPTATPRSFVARLS